MGLIEIILYIAVIVIGFIAGRATGGTKQILLALSDVLKGVISTREELKQSHPKVEEKLAKKNLID